MSGLSWKWAGLFMALGLAAAIAGGSPAEAAAPKSKFEQAKLKAAVIYRKYYWKQQDAAILGSEYKDLQEETAKLREQWQKALDDAVKLDPVVLRAEEALRRAESKPEDKRDADEISRRTEDLQIARQNADVGIESKIHEHVFDVADDDVDDKKPVACGPADQKRIEELQKRIGIYEKRVAEAEQELKNIREALRNAVKDQTGEVQRVELREKEEIFDRRVKRLKHNLDEYKAELDKLLNPPPCPPPSTSKQEDKPDKPAKKTTEKKQKNETANETSAPTSGFTFGGGGMRRDGGKREEGVRSGSEPIGRSGGGLGGPGAR